MYNKITLLLQLVIDKLRNFHIFLKSKQEKSFINDNYSSLSPIADADKDRHYTNALNWALQTRHENDIRNIAITGPYGSGKSSVLKTYQSNYKSKDLQFLNISLATFKEENLTDDYTIHTDNLAKNNLSLPIINREISGKRTNSADLIRLIELSILQQIFYHADDSEIPESRFRKIKRINKWTIRWKSIATILFITSLIFLWR